MTYSVFFMEEANADINNIVDYISQDNGNNALRFIEQLQQRIEDTLSMVPKGGRRFAGARYIVFGNYIYREKRNATNSY